MKMLFSCLVACILTSGCSFIQVPQERDSDHFTRRSTMAQVDYIIKLHRDYERRSDAYALWLIRHIAIAEQSYLTRDQKEFINRALSEILERSNNLYIIQRALELYMEI